MFMEVELAVSRQKGKLQSSFNISKKYDIYHRKYTVWWCLYKNVDDYSLDIS